MRLPNSSTHRLKIVIPLIILLPLVVAAAFPASISQSPNLSIPQSTTHQIETIVNLGVPAGNGSTPKNVALNSQAGQIYILTEGIPALKQGNGLSVYDIASGDIIEHVKINQGNNEALDLQFDPVSGLLFALWREQLSDASPSLSVIDSQSMQTIQNIPGIERFVTEEGRLYTADTERLVVYELSGSNLVERQSIDLSTTTPGPMAVSLDTNRLYMARNSDGIRSIEIFEANGLVPVGSIPIDGPVLDLLPLSFTDNLLVVTAADSFRVLYRFDTNGELADLPYELGPRFGAAGVALSQDGEQLYFSNGQPGSTDSDTAGPALIGLTNGDLSPLLDIPLPTNFDDLVVDDETNQAFAIYPFDNFLYVIDLENETVKIVNTAIEIRDVLLDEASNQIFVSDSANRIRRMSAESFEVLAERQLKGNSNDYGFKSAAWAGELALDRERNRLYVSGFPAIVLEADTLTEITTLEPGGQLVPDPTSDNFYVSNCGITILDVSTLRGDTLIPGSGPRADGLSPNPCVGYSQLDMTNQLLYSLVPNGTPGSNSGNFLYVYDLSLEPSLVFTDTEISVVRVELDSYNRRAFVNTIREGNQRLRVLDVPASGSIEYTHQLLGLWGDSQYSPTTNRLYISDRDHNRLLTLNADTLSVIGEFSLPPNYYFQLTELNPTNDRLYLIGLDGQLLVAAPNENPIGLEQPSSIARNPTGDILSLESTDGGDILARIEAEYDNKSDIHLYHSSDEGQTWTDLSQNLPSFPVQALAVSSSNQVQTLFAGLATLGQSGGLYKSTDSGQSWTAAMAGLQDLWVDDLFISPDFEQTGLILAKTTHAGLHQSTDGGQTWTPLAPLSPNGFFPSASQSAAVAFDGWGVVLVSQAIEAMQGIYRATLQPDGTLSEWEQVLDRPVDKLAFSPNGEIALAYGDGLWHSTDGGETWAAGGMGLTGVGNLNAQRIFFSPNFVQDKTVYLYFNGISSDTPSLLFRSTDGGQHWQLWIDPINGGNNFTSVAPTAEGDFVFGDSNTQLTRLSPSDLSWVDSETILSRFLLSDLAASPDYKADQTLFALSSEYGLFKSSNGGQDWQLTSFPVRTHRFNPRDYHLAISPAYAQDQTLYISTGRSLHRSTDGGHSWEQLQLNPNPALSLPAQKIVLSPNFARAHTLLAGTATAVYRSIDSGDTWQSTLTPETSASAIDVLSFAPDGDTIYARFGYSHNLFISTDGGQNWQAQPSSIGEYFTVIDTTSTLDNSLLAVMEFDTRLVQAGPQIPPWQDFSQSLPAELTSIQAVVYGPNDTLVIGGQGGVFRTSDNGQSWQSFSTGLPSNANIHHLYATDTTLFTALADGSIFTYTDSDTSWIDISVVK